MVPEQEYMDIIKKTFPELNIDIIQNQKNPQIKTYKNY